MQKGELDQLIRTEDRLPEKGRTEFRSAFNSLLETGEINFQYLITQSLSIESPTAIQVSQDKPRKSLLDRLFNWIAAQ
jgi:hypothetical protein